jgi:hypothetical protein
MKKTFFRAFLVLMCTVGCASFARADEAKQVTDAQRDRLTKVCARLEQECAQNRALLLAVDQQVVSLNQRLDEAETRVRLLIEMESANVCLHQLPADLSRAEEIQQAHARWLEALTASDVQRFTEQEIMILERQYIQAVQRALTTESTRIQTLTRELEAKEKRSDALRTQQLHLDRQILATQEALKAL